LPCWFPPSLAIESFWGNSGINAAELDLFLLTFSRLPGFFWFRLGIWLETKGITGVAETCFRHACNAGGKVGTKAVVHLGKKLLAGGQFSEALTAYTGGICSDPDNPRLWCGLGAAHRHLAGFEEARKAYVRALEIEPDYPEALTNLGEWWLVKGEPETALEYFDRVLRRDPRFYEALANRVAALFECGRFDEAEAAARNAIELYPDSALLHVNLGNVLVHTGKARPGLLAYRKALELQPGYDEALFNLAILQNNAEALQDSVSLIHRRMAERGESAYLTGMLALALKSSRQLAAAEATCRKLLDRHPDHVIALVTLANCLSARGNSVESIEYYEKAVALRPDMSGIFSNVPFESNYLPDLTADELFRRHRLWAERYEVPLSEKQFKHTASGDPKRKLKIGYVSGDFCNHPVGSLLRDVVRCHNRQEFELHCFSSFTVSDQVTEAIRQNADSWHEIQLMSDEDVATLIRGLDIDILVDLSGHTAFNRLPVFALRPAPVQATWIGYFHSTGLSSIDYFITDPYTSPHNSKQHFSEIPVRLPHTRFCYSPPDYVPAVAESPAARNGYVTFGSFIRPEKLVDPVIDAWTRIVMAVPQARLILKAGGLNDEETAGRLRGRFEAQGMDPERLILRGSSNHHQMFEEYGDVDIALDPFPFNGGMTTLEALWMGVPVVTLAGDNIVSRQAASALTNVGLQNLVLSDWESYIAAAIALAGDPHGLAELRREIRLRMSRSPLCRPEEFARDLEYLYRRMWEAWCNGRKLDAEVVVKASAVSRRKVLHVGCGGADVRSLPAYFQGFWDEVRLDINPAVRPDIVASMLDMSAVAEATIDAVFSSHNIEHLYPHEVELALKEFRRVLKPEGLLVLTCPDLQAVCALVAADKLDEPAYVSPAGPIAPLDMLYGHRASMAKGNLYMAHKTGFTVTTLEESLVKSGFNSCTIRQGVNFDLLALAYPGAPSCARVQSDFASCWPTAQSS
jgi:predicted O-linked N-acetylglucosamine transferase (SPINDLY family)